MTSVTMTVSAQSAARTHRATHLIVRAPMAIAAIDARRAVVMLANPILALMDVVCNQELLVFNVNVMTAMLVLDVIRVSVKEKTRHLSAFR